MVQNPKTCVGLLAALLLTTAAPVWAEGVGPGTTVPGSGVMVCRIAYAFDEMGCDPRATLEGHDLLQRIETEGARRVTFVLEWQAVSSDANELSVWLHGNQSACIDETGDPECHLVNAIGPSPLSASLEGEVVANYRISASIGLARTCPPVSGAQWLTECNPTDIRIVRDQPFTFTWVVE